MAEDDSKQTDDGSSKLAILCEREAELRGKYDEHIRYLRVVARFCSSTEEQQRIVGDIDELREKLIQVEEEIWTLENDTLSS